MRTVADLDVAGKRVFLRADLNVPLADGRVADPTRIEATLPTLRLLLGRGAAPVVVASHLGRPKGRPDPRYSLRPVADALAALLGRPVTFAPDCIGEATERLVRAAGAGGVVLLENLRFHPG